MSTPTVPFVVLDEHNTVLGIGTTTLDAFALMAADRRAFAVGDITRFGLGDTYDPETGELTKFKPIEQIGYKLINLPKPSTVIVDGETTYVVPDGELELDFDHPGTYLVHVVGGPLFTMDKHDARPS